METKSKGDELTKKQRLLLRLKEEWAKVFPGQRVFFVITKEYPASYSPRYRGKRDYSRKTLVIIKHSLQMPQDAKPLNRFFRTMYETHQHLSFQY